MPYHTDRPAELVATLLLDRKFTCCPEPEWITCGKKPDFFCTGRADIWVEVKSFGQTPDQKQAERVFCWFESRREIDRPGARVNAAYASDVTEQDVKEAVSRVHRVLTRSDLCDYQRLLVTIPNKPDFATDIEFTAYSRGQKLLIVSAKDNAGCYGAPYLHWQIKDNDKVEVSENGNRCECTARELGLDGDDVKVGVLVEPWTHHELSLSGLIEIGDATIGWPDRCRLLSDANDAAKQLKNALKYKSAPTMIFFVSNNDTSESCQIRIQSLFSLLYGQHTLQWPSSNPDEACVIHGRDAFWRRDKNTSVSAGCYVSNGEQICVIHNRFAKYPSPEAFLGCPEFRGLENGKIARVR